jgi:hypothetical protein
MATVEQILGVLGGQISKGVGDLRGLMMKDGLCQQHDGNQHPDQSESKEPHGKIRVIPPHASSRE